MSEPLSPAGSFVCVNDLDLRKSPRLAVAVAEEQFIKSIRRSTRDPSRAAAELDRNDVKTLIKRIHTNHQSTVILKIKHHIQSDISTVIFDAIIEALTKNTVCQVSTYCTYLQVLNIIYAFHSSNCAPNFCCICIL